MYGFLFTFRSNYGSILYRFGDKARYWSKIAFIHTPLHSTPPLGVFPSEYYHTVWYVKTLNKRSALCFRAGALCSLKQAGGSPSTLFLPFYYTELLSAVHTGDEVSRIGNKVERIRQQSTLLPVSATVDFQVQQSRPC